ncbi:MAG TPA: abortive infection system antitoxin AbiGi family protein [Puia sp.]|uniref:abortive infection system antitoxin AbiGi family protein n=1 Tax=Puia sp. TaxID=2045100 RepID=UPI002CA36D8D|nr:abortive infection system antitoxin AbiGi family protein [Puia sp.]HVU98330.1 abortive infection system antitoxin AbiGi family protein [Puia sp.]
MYKSLTSIANTQMNLFRYIKNYQGLLYRDGPSAKKYIYYDEKEWRYIPEISDARVKASLTKEEFTLYRGKSKMKPFVDRISLSFKANDIKYLLVRSTSDIPKLLKHLRTVEGLVQNASEFEILSTKIFTIENLTGDF